MTKIIRTVKYVRGPFGTLVKWLFIGFNLLMAIWLFSYWGDVAPVINSGSGAEQAGAAIGSTIGTGLILMSWVLGTVVLGIPVLLTRGKRVEIEESPSPATVVQSPQDNSIHAEATPQENTEIKIKAKSVSKLALHYMGFAFFLLMGIGLMYDSFLTGFGIVIAGALLLPAVQERLADTHLKSPTAIGIAMVCVVVFFTYIGASGSSSSVQDTAQQTNVAQQDLQEDAKKAFSKNPEQVLQEISKYVESKDWASVKTRAEPLLGTGSAEIKKFYDEATAELKKEEEAKKKQEQERLSAEFKEKRAGLVAELKKEIDSGNYEYAKNIGAQYIEVADEEFKKLHNTAAEKQALEAASAPWSYSQNDDPMSKDKTYYASISSTNSVEFDFPYSGVQHGTLTLRTDPRYGKDVIFSIEKGQVLCPSYDGCTVLVRFDDGDATSYSAAGAADNSTETIFIRNYSRFLEKMMKAKRVRISVNIYQEGAPVFDFDVGGFNANKYKPKK